jgi:hypothetical protein
LKCGFDSIKTRGFFKKITPKGYPAIWTVGSDPNGPDLKEGDGAAHQPEKKAARRRHGRKWQSSPAFSKLATLATI